MMWVVRAVWWLTQHVGAYIYGVAVLAVAGVAVAVVLGLDPMRSVLGVALVVGTWVSLRYLARAVRAWRQS